MSPQDDRKVLEIRLPKPLRKALAATTPAQLSLAYLTRHALRQALAQGVALGDPVKPGGARSVLLQLSAAEHAQLHAFARSHGISAEVAVLSLVAAVV